MSIRRWAAWSVLAVGLVGQVVLAAPERAFAQTTTPLARPDATPKGTVGLALIGAEVGILVPALCGLDDTWALITFPLVGAAGGALGGYFGLDRPNHNGASVAMLVTGLALVMPTVVSTMAALKHDRDREIERRAERVRRLAMAGPGAVRLVDGRLTLGMPGIGVGQAFSRDEIVRYGAVATNEIRIALFSGSF